MCKSYLWLTCFNILLPNNFLEICSKFDIHFVTYVVASTSRQTNKVDYKRSYLFIAKEVAMHLVKCINLIYG